MTKTVVVLGADGRSGRECVKALLAAGYSVRAGVRSGQLEPHDRLTQRFCDVTNLENVQDLLKDSQLVVSLIGHGRNSPRTLQTTAMKNCLATLADKKSARLISLTGTGVRQPGDKPSLIDKVLNFAINLIDPDRISDGVEHAKVLQTSSIDWTILRVLKLTGGRHSGQIKLSSAGPAELFTPRARVAAAIVDIIEHDSYRQAAPVVAGRAKNNHR